MVAITSVDAYPFLAFSDLTCFLEERGIGAGCTVPPDSKARIKMAVGYQTLSNKKCYMSGIHVSKQDILSLHSITGYHMLKII